MLRPPGRRRRCRGSRRRTRRSRARARCWPAAAAAAPAPAAAVAAQQHQQWSKTAQRACKWRSGPCHPGSPNPRALARLTFAASMSGLKRSKESSTLQLMFRMLKASVAAAKIATSLQPASRALQHIVIMMMMVAVDAEAEWGEARGQQPAAPPPSTATQPTHLSKPLILGVKALYVTPGRRAIPVMTSLASPICKQQHDHEAPAMINTSDTSTRSEAKTSYAAASTQRRPSARVCQRPHCGQAFRSRAALCQLCSLPPHTTASRSRSCRSRASWLPGHATGVVAWAGDAPAAPISRSRTTSPRCTAAPCRRAC